jgi:hypothetical protein
VAVEPEALAPSAPPRRAQIQYGVVFQISIAADCSWNRGTFRATGSGVRSSDHDGMTARSAAVAEHPMRKDSVWLHLSVSVFTRWWAVDESRQRLRSPSTFSDPLTGAVASTI